MSDIDWFGFENRIRKIIQQEVIEPITFRLQTLQDRNDELKNELNHEHTRVDDIAARLSHYSNSFSNRVTSSLISITNSFFVE